MHIGLIYLRRAYGEFEATADCSDITSANFLRKAGKKSPVLLRVSTVGPESGSADTARDVHGWAMKIYTDEGNQDWVFNNTVGFYKHNHSDTAAESSKAHLLHPRPN